MNIDYSHTHLFTNHTTGLIDEVIPAPAPRGGSGTDQALLDGALRFIQRQPRPLAARRTKDRGVPELASVSGEAAAVEACRALAAKELKGKVAPVER